MTSHTPERPWWSTVFVFGPHAGAHRVAARAGISVVIPLLTVWALGHVEWSLYAAFGSFTALYGRNLGYRHRFAMQLSAALVLVGAVVLGVLLAGVPGHEWWIIAVGSIWATLVAVLSDVFRWNPPGPLFGVFALCAVASVPPGPNSLLIAFVVSAAAALLSLAVGSAGAVLVRRATGRRDPASVSSAASASASQPEVPATSGTEHPSSPSVPASGHESPRASARPSSPRFGRVGAERFAHAARFGVAAAVAGSLSTALGIGHPYWAMIAAVVPLVAVRLSHSLVRATHRVAGTFLGLILAALLLSLQPSGLAAILLVVALQIAAELFVVRNYGFALLFVTPLALVMIDLAHPTDTRTLIVDRLVETALGTAVALLVAAATHYLWRRPAPAIA